MIRIVRVIQFDVQASPGHIYITRWPGKLPVDNLHTNGVTRLDGNEVILMNVREDNARILVKKR